MIKELLLSFRKSLKKEEHFVFWATLIFYFLLLFNLNNKTLVLFFFIYLFVLYGFLKDFKKSLLLAYLASWPFNVGKTYVFELVPPSQINLPYHPYGIGPIIVISIREIFIVLMFLILFRCLVLERKNLFKFDRKSTLLTLYFFSLFISSLVGSMIREISLIISLFFISPLIFYWYINGLTNKRKSLLKASIAVFSSIMVFEALLASIQFFKGSTLGISIEASYFLPFDFSAEAQGISYYRPVGTFAHANGLADFLLVFLFIFLPSLFFEFKKFGKILFFSFLAGFGTLLLTLGRSAWGSFFISFLFFLFVVEKRWKLRLRFNKMVLRTFFLCAPFVLPFFIFILLPRMINTFFSFQIYGAGYTRVEMIKEAWETIRKFPLFGIGLGMETYYSYQTAIFRNASVFSTFPEAVHNGYLNHLVQTGIFSFAFFVTISISFLRNLMSKISREKNIPKKILGLSLVCGFLSIYLNSLLHPGWPDLQKVVFISTIYLVGNEDV